MSEDAPFTIENIPFEDEEDQLEIKFFIAPKVDDESEFDFSEFEENNEKSSGSVEEELDKYKMKL